MDGLSINVKASVKVATTINGTLATAFANGIQVDGVTLVTGDRILIKNQSTASENGIYTVNSTGAPTRADDFNSNGTYKGAFTFVEQGTINANSGFVCTTVGSITFTSGTSNTSIAFTQYSSAQPGSGSVTTAKIADGAVTSAKLAPDSVITAKIADGAVTSAKIAVGAIDLATNKVTGTLPVANGGTGLTSLGNNVATFLGTPSSANLISAITDETGTGSLVFATSPTLTTPKFVDGGYIADANGNESIVFGTTASAINEIKITNAITGTGPIIAAQGGDTDVDLNLNAKGAGSVLISKANIAGSSSLTIGDGTNIVLNATTGTKIGTATDQKLGFYNATPIIQPANAAQSAVTSQGLSDTATETYSPTDMTKVQTELNAVTALANEMRTILVNLGLMKGSA